MTDTTIEEQPGRRGRSRRRPCRRARPEPPERGPDVVFDLEDLDVYYGASGPCATSTSASTSTRSPRSSARPAAARPPCCAASTA